MREHAVSHVKVKRAFFRALPGTPATTNCQLSKVHRLQEHQDIINTTAAAFSVGWPPGSEQNTTNAAFSRDKWSDYDCLQGGHAKIGTFSYAS